MTQSARHWLPLPSLIVALRFGVGSLLISTVYFGHEMLRCVFFVDWNKMNKMERFWARTLILLDACKGFTVCLGIESRNPLSNSLRLTRQLLWLGFQLLWHSNWQGRTPLSGLNWFTGYLNHFFSWPINSLNWIIVSTSENSWPKWLWSTQAVMHLVRGKHILKN